MQTRNEQTPNKSNQTTRVLVGDDTYVQYGPVNNNTELRNRAPVSFSTQSILFAQEIVLNWYHNNVLMYQVAILRNRNTVSHHTE